MTEFSIRNLWQRAFGLAGALFDIWRPMIDKQANEDMQQRFLDESW